MTPSELREKIEAMTTQLNAMAQVLESADPAPLEGSTAEQLSQGLAVVAEQSLKAANVLSGQRPQRPTSSAA